MLYCFTPFQSSSCALLLAIGGGIKNHFDFHTFHKTPQIATLCSKTRAFMSHGGNDDPILFSHSISFLPNPTSHKNAFAHHGFISLHPCDKQSNERSTGGKQWNMPADEGKGVTARFKDDGRRQTKGLLSAIETLQRERKELQERVEAVEKRHSEEVGEWAKK